MTKIKYWLTSLSLLVTSSSALAHPGHGFSGHDLYAAAGIILASIAAFTLYRLKQHDKN